MTRVTLRGLGMSDAAITRAVHRGELVRLGPGTFAVPDLVDGLTALAAALAAHPAAVGSHRAAARVWGLDGITDEVLEITVPWRVRSRLVLAHRNHDLAAFEIVVHRGLRVTDPTRTLCDVGAFIGLDELERATESALRRRLTSPARLAWRASQLARPGRAGPPALRAVLARRPPGAPATESDLETRYLQCLRDHGIPEPVRQFPVTLPGGRVVRLDHAWPDAKVFTELDGWATHGDRDAFRRDRSRQNQLVALGWWPLRFTHDDVARDPTATAAQTYAALARSEGSSCSLMSRSNRPASPATQLRQSG